MTIETSYQLRLREAEAAMAVARGALGRDLAAAIAGQTWATQMRDVHDVRALATKIVRRGECSEVPLATKRIATQSAQKERPPRGGPSDIR